MPKHIIILILLVSIFVPGCSNMENRHESVQPTKQQPKNMTRQVTLKIDYLLYLPKNYDGQEQWPLIVFLHGIGERGNDLDRVKAEGLPKLIKEGKELPFIIASPQCPENTWWPSIAEQVMALIDELSDNYNVDENRIYLTGLSLGGFGTWSIACDYPQRFAAVAPICGGGMPFLAPNLKNLPVWAFHGDADAVVPVEKSKEMVDTINKTGGNAKLTVYPEVGHDSWTRTYNNNELYEWFLSHSKISD